MVINNMDLRYFFIAIFPRYSMIFFIVCVSMAMYFYSGGIYHMVIETGGSSCPGSSCIDINHHTKSYSFSKNFLSDLGRTISHGGHNNFHSSLLFNMALSFGGITYILFYVYLGNLFRGNKIAMLGSITGVSGAICFIGVAFTPADLFLPPHIMFNLWIFRFFLIATVCYSWIIYKSKRIDNKYLIGNAIFIASLIFYILVLMFGPTPREPGGLEFQAISQKFIMFNFLASIIVQTLGFSKLLNNY